MQAAKSCAQRLGAIAMAFDYSKWDNIDVSDDEEGEMSPLDMFLAQKKAAVEQGKIPAAAKTESCPAPPMREQQVLADGDVCFAQGLDDPWSVAALPGSDGEVLVAERGGRLVVLAADGSVVRTLPCLEGVDDVAGMAVTESAAYVIDCGQHCIYRLALPEGRCVGKFQGVEPPAKQEPTDWMQRATDDTEAPLDSLRYPRGCAVSTVGEQACLFVSDSGNKRVVVYDAETLEPLRSIGRARKKPVWEGPHAERPNKFEMAEGGVMQPMGLCILDDVLCVVDAHEHRLSLYEVHSGDFLRTMGGEGVAPGLFRSPFDVATSRGKLFVVEGARVQVLEPDGAPNQAVELAKSVRNLVGLSLSADGTQIYACDAPAGCVRRLDFIERAEALAFPKKEGGEALAGGKGASSAAAPTPTSAEKLADPGLASLAAGVGGDSLSLAPLDLL